MTIEIRQHEPGGDVSDFKRAGFVVFEGDPAWVAPLDMVLSEKLTPKRDPFHRHAEVALFTAWQGGRLVGRMSATVDQSWLSYWKDETGHFGYFDTVDDLEIARALFSRAEAWLLSKGMKRVNGPMSLGANQEVGVLVEGFDTPPMIEMGHSRVYQGGLAERCGYTKEKDLLCWRYDATTELNARTLKAWEGVRALPEVKLRSVDMGRLREELGVIIEIYNETWAGKWGYVPITREELDKMASDFSLVLDPDIAFIAEIDGSPAGMCITVPNLNELTVDLGGRLFPFGWAKLVWRAKVAGPKTSRLILLGVREEYRKQVKRYGGLSSAMYAEVAQRGRKKGYQWAELSWTREDDAPINIGIRSMGAKVYKKYRVYEKRLGGW